MIRRGRVDSGTGLRLGYLRLGSRWASLPGTPPLVLLHGLGGDTREWLLTGPFLARRRTVFALDLPAHGRSDAPVGPVPQELRFFADAVLGALSVLLPADLPIDLLGHSLGGAVALDIAIRAPRRLRKLILVDTPALTPMRWMRPTSLSIPFVPETLSESRRLLAASVSSPLLGHPLVANLLRLVRRTRARPAKARLVAQLAEGVGLATRSQLRSIGNETLVIWGDADEIFPIGLGQEVARAIPHARLAIVTGCGHVPPLERPRAFARCVDGFLRG